MTRKALLAVAASIPFAVGAGPVDPAGAASLSPQQIANDDHTKDIDAQHNQTRVLILISDQGTGSSSFVNLLRNKDSPCLLSLSELFTKERRWAFDSEKPKFGLQGLWDYNDPKPSKIYQNGYRNEELEKELAKVIARGGKDDEGSNYSYSWSSYHNRWYSSASDEDSNEDDVVHKAGTYGTEISESDVRKGLQHAYDSISKITDFVKFIKKVQAYAAGAVPGNVRTRCKDRMVISLKLFPLFIGGGISHISNTHVNSLDEIDPDPTAAELWKSIMKDIHDDPQVSAVHLLRDETKRELSNWRRFQPYKKKAEDTQSLRFNCDFKRPMTEFAKLTEQYSGARVIEPTHCWESKEKTMHCFKTAMDIAGLPVDEFVDEGFELSDDVEGAEAGGKKAGPGGLHPGREVTCEQGGWLCLKSENKIAAC